MPVSNEFAIMPIEVSSTQSADQKAATMTTGAAQTAPVGPLREVRFAVVMYGGVSLAIYIHGVARELFHLVQSTARQSSGQAVVERKDLEGAEGVYRKLSQLLENKALEEDFPE